MLKLRHAGLALALSLPCAAPAGAEPPPFACRLRETQAFLPELATFSGYRWIECRVIGPEIANVDGVVVNGGRCQTFDYWFAGRSFARGDAINIPYACMSALNVTIAANGLLWPVKLR